MDAMDLIGWTIYVLVAGGAVSLGYSMIKARARDEVMADNDHLRLGYHKVRGGGYVHEDSPQFEEYRRRGKLLN